MSACIDAAQGLLNIKQGLEAARVEENFQIEGWGLVEGGHDIDSLGVATRTTKRVRPRVGAER